MYSAGHKNELKLRNIWMEFQFASCKKLVYYTYNPKKY